MQGRANFVAHRGQEVLHGPLGGLGPGAFLPQFLLVPNAVGEGEYGIDVAADASVRMAASVHQHGVAVALGILKFVAQFAHLPLKLQQVGVVGLVVNLSANAQQVLEATLADQGVLRIAQPLDQGAVDARNPPARTGVQDATGQLINVGAAGVDQAGTLSSVRKLRRAAVVASGALRFGQWPRASMRA